MQPKMSCFVGGGSSNFQPSFKAGGGGQSVLCQMGGLSHVFSNQHISENLFLDELVTIIRE